VLLRLNCHVANLSASLEISLPYQAVYHYLLDNPVSGPSFVPTVIAALHPSNKRYIYYTARSELSRFYYMEQGHRGKITIKKLTISINLYPSKPGFLGFQASSEFV